MGTNYLQTTTSPQSNLSGNALIDIPGGVFLDYSKSCLTDKNIRHHRWVAILLLDCAHLVPESSGN